MSNLKPEPPLPAVTVARWPIGLPRIDTTFLDAGYYAGVKDGKGGWAMPPGYWHTGLDLNRQGTSGNGDKGRSVRTCATGRVIVAENVANSPIGGLVVVEHKLADGRRRWSRHMHLQNIRVKVGQLVLCTEDRQDQLGEIGNAGGRFLAHDHWDILHEAPPLLLGGWKHWPRRYGPKTDVTRFYTDPAVFMRVLGAREALE